MNKGIKIVLVLSIVSGGMALALAGVNALTAGKIAENTAKKELEAKKSIFPDCEYFEPTSIVQENPQYLKSVEKVYTTNTKEDLKGLVYNCSGKNAYGEVAFMLGLDYNPDIEGPVDRFVFKKISVITNTESYGSTLTDKYINPLNDYYFSYTDPDAIKCGATYGAKLVRDMIMEAVSDANKQEGF